MLNPFGTDEWLKTKHHIVKIVFMQNKEIEFLGNNVLIVDKFYIHKYRLVKVYPFLKAFKMILELYFNP